MSNVIRISKVLLAIGCAATLISCDAPKETTSATTAAASTTAAPKQPAPAKSAAPKKSASVKKPTHPCPEGSEGEGTFKKPCVAKGNKRIMEVKWTGKTTDKGPQFSVKSLAKLEILYGKIVVYFYDKAGKQLEVERKDGKMGPNLPCFGNIFAGPMKPNEKAVLWFSCVKKKHVPEGTDAIEAEIQRAGFPPKPGAPKSDTYWSNTDLTPNERPKGGIK